MDALERTVCVFLAMLLFVWLLAPAIAPTEMPTPSEETAVAEKASESLNTLTKRQLVYYLIGGQVLCALICFVIAMKRPKNY